MGLLDVGANMQSNSYFPGCYFTRNFEGNVNGSVWPGTNDNKMFESGHKQSGLLNLFAADHHLGYSKEAMKEIMLNHEAIFRDQIHELHRLYRRQRELMAETKRNESYKHSLMAETSRSDSLFSQISSECIKKTCQVPTFPWKESTYNQSSVSVGKKILSCGRELLDLEYLDGQKELPLMEKKFPQVPEKLFLGYNGVNSFCEAPTPDPFSRRTEVIADLNEPFWPGEEAAFENGQGKPSLNSSPPALCAEKLSFSIKSCKEPKSVHELPISYYLEQSCRKLSAERKDFGITEPFDQVGKVEASSGEGTRYNKNLTKTSHTFPKDENICKIDINSEQVPEKGLEKSIVYFRGQIDLNVCINDELSPACSTPTEIDLEAPASPENKERSPPRGESDENPLETPLLISGLNDDELVKIAAETLASISSFQDQTPSRSISINSLQPSFELLFWFSTIVSSVLGDCTSEIEAVSNDVDYFEVMTLKLKDTKTEEYARENNGRKEGKGASLSPRKGKTGRMGKHKDVQSHVLPSRTSLSRYKVTEDLQTIRGLVEETGVLTENAGRTRLGRGKRRRDISVFDNSQTMIGLVLKQVCSSGSEGRVDEGRFIGWGKINRRRRGRRYPASNNIYSLFQAN